ncbi:hypothetical protein [Methylobacterium sp. Leaf108]|uniref:hypothetical protein n=1 Tax=Methylobacterium sp. Leaf108 TaxID=1736256 RepID=UPI000A481B0C|nr:hypothetical protein [Methylobacterium sp. Leaf108]
MFLLMFAAIGGGLATASILSPFGATLAAVGAPFGGSLCALLAAVYLTRHGADAVDRNGRDGHDEERRTDALVAALRDVAARGAVVPQDVVAQDIGAQDIVAQDVGAQDIVPKEAGTKVDGTSRSRVA